MRRVGGLMIAVALCAGLFAWNSRVEAAGRAGRKLVDNVPAVYPEIAKRYHIRGLVKLEVVVRADGSVKSAKVLGGSPLLIDSASEAVRKWKFEPGSQETVEDVELRFGE